MEEVIKRARSKEAVTEIGELTFDGTTATPGDLKRLAEFPNVEILSMNNMKLTSLEGFPPLAKLVKLELNDNRLSGGLEHLKGCKALRYLSLMNNRLKDLGALDPLKDLPKLQGLDVERNEDLGAEEDYRDDIFVLLPQLKYVDGKNREGEDVEEDESLDEDEEEEEEDYEEDEEYSGSGEGEDEEANGDEDEDEEGDQEDEAGDEEAEEEEDAEDNNEDEDNEDEDEEGDSAAPPAKKSRTS